MNNRLSVILLPDVLALSVKSCYWWITLVSLSHLH